MWKAGASQAGSQGSQRVGRALVAAQIAITLVLVIGAGLLGRSLLKVLEVDPGFRVDKIVAMDVSLPWVDDPKAKSAQGVFFSNLIDRLAQIPGVRSVGAASALPLTGGLPDGMFLLMTPEEAPKTHGRVRGVFPAKGASRELRIFASRPMDISGCWEFRWSADECLTSATLRTRRTWR